MPRAKRHFISGGYVWHITHRCHKRDFLLRFSKDRDRYLHWLYEARKRYRLEILNYMVTSNHVHLLVLDSGKKDAIPRSLQLVAGRTGQEYNQRKGRKGAYWEDRYHATAVESGDHLARCMTYIDTNMVRAGVVRHPSLWPHCGYNEIQQPRKRYTLIAYGILPTFFGADSYEQLQIRHRGWSEKYLARKQAEPQREWTNSVAVGSEAFVEKVKARLGFKVRGRKVFKGDEGYHLREKVKPYMAISDAQKCGMDQKNTYFWNIFK